MQILNLGGWKLYFYHKTKYDFISKSSSDRMKHKTFRTDLRLHTGRSVKEEVLFYTNYYTAYQDKLWYTKVENQSRKL